MLKKKNVLEKIFWKIIFGKVLLLNVKNKIKKILGIGDLLIR